MKLLIQIKKKIKIKLNIQKKIKAKALKDKYLVNINKNPLIMNLSNLLNNNKNKMNYASLMVKELHLIKLNSNMIKL